MDIKDFLHLYIGCDVHRENHFLPDELSYEDGKLVGISASEVEHGKTVAIIDCGLEHFPEWYVEETKPILRKLSDMTEEERLKYGWTIEDTDEGIKVNWPFESFRLLCKDGWDLFGLIPAGLAIDKTSLKN